MKAEKTQKKSSVQVSVVNIATIPGNKPTTIPESVTVDIDVPQPMLKDSARLFDFIEDRTYSVVSGIVHAPVAHCQIFIQSINGKIA